MSATACGSIENTVESGHCFRDAGRIRGRLSLKELGRLAGGIHHDAVGIAIRRFTQRLQSDRTLLEKVALVQKELESR